jgi:class 3 adenylate cyclase/Tfp pilus assembly protein PilF
LKRKIAVILAADIAGYSRLIAEDEEETLRRFEGYRAVFIDFVDRAGGRVFNTAGDSILAEFQSAVEAVRCAVDVQETLRARNLAYPPSRHMNFRIGITIGDVVERDNGDLLGDGVNIAARLESVAPPGGICVSRSVHEAVASKMALRFADAGPQALKNIPERIHAYTLALEDSEAASVTISPPSVDEDGQPAPRPPRPARQINWTTVALSLAALLVAGVYALRYIPGLKTEEPLPLDGAAAPATPGENGASTAIAVAPSGTTEPEIETAARTPEPDLVKKAPSPLASRYVLTRQWTECQSDDPKVAAPACERLLDSAGLSQDDQAEITYRYGRALRDTGETDKAVEILTRAIDLNPTADAYNYRGIAHYDQGEYPKAIADYDEAVRLSPLFAEAINNRAWTRFKDGDLKPALEDANRAIEIDNGKAYIWDTRGHINEALGSRTAAIADFRTALELDSASDSSTEGLRRLGAAAN